MGVVVGRVDGSTVGLVVGRVDGTQVGRVDGFLEGVVDGTTVSVEVVGRVDGTLEGWDVTLPRSDGTVVGRKVPDVGILLTLVYPSRLQGMTAV